MNDRELCPLWTQLEEIKLHDPKFRNRHCIV